MKKNLKRIALFFAVLLLALVPLSSCDTEDDNSGAENFQVEVGLQWKKVYQVGEKLSLDGLTGKYYEDIDDEDDYKKVTIKESMISGFDTSKVGSYTMTVTYKGKSDQIDYKVVAKAEQFEINKTFCIGENTVASINSATMKAKISVFDNYFKAVDGHSSKTEEKTLSYLVNGQGETCISFDYNGLRYDIFYDAESGQYTMKTVSADNSAASSSTQTIHPITLNALHLPQKNVAYKSEAKDGVYYSIKLDDSYNAVVTKHTAEGDTVTDSFTANESVLTTNGFLRYSQHKDGYYAYAMLNNRDQFKIRKELEDSIESIYSVLCSPAE